jgi:hypothetical protein
MEGLRVLSMRILAAGLLCLCTAGVFAQEFRATISGRVFDGTGAAIVGAQVQALNMATQETTNSTVDTSGVYSLPFLRPGLYRITVRSDGFKTFIRDNINVQVGQIVGLDVTMELGAVTETVEVTSEIALLETQTASRSGIV